MIFMHERLMSNCGLQFSSCRSAVVQSAKPTVWSPASAPRVPMTRTPRLVSCVANWGGMTSHVGRPLNSIRPPLTSRTCSQNLARPVTSTGATATSFANAERSVRYCDSHLSERSSDLKQNGTQEKTPFSGTVSHYLSYGEVLFVLTVSFWNHQIDASHWLKEEFWPVRKCFL